MSKLSRQAVGGFVSSLPRALLLLLWLFTALSCSDEPAQQQAEEPTTGGIVLRMVPPPETPELWPLPDKWRMIVIRSKGFAGTKSQTALDTASPSDTPRIEPFVGEVTVLTVVLQDENEVMQAKAVTAPAFIDSSAPDREVDAFLAPAGVASRVVTAVSADAKPLLHPGRLGEAVAVTANGEVVLSGGAPYVGGNPCEQSASGAPVDEIWRFDPADHSLTKLPSMASPRSFHTATALSGGVIVLAGGYLSAGSSSAKTSHTVDLLSINQGTVSTAPNPLKNARARHCAVEVDGRVVLAGGVGPGSNSIELWDPGVGTVAQGTLQQPRRDPRCALVKDPVSEQNQIWLVGGSAGDDGFFQSSVDRIEVWRIDGSKLVNEGVIEQPAGQVSMHVASVLSAPRGVMIAGGFGPSGTSQPLATVWWRPLPSLNWVAGQSLSVARGCAAVAVVGTRALLVGGMTNNGQPADTIDVLQFDAATPRLAAKRSLPAPRAGAHASVLAGGAILLNGGVVMSGGKLVASDRLQWMWP